MFSLTLSEPSQSFSWIHWKQPLLVELRYQNLLQWDPHWYGGADGHHAGGGHQQAQDIHT